MNPSLPSNPEVRRPTNLVDTLMRKLVVKTLEEKEKILQKSETMNPREMAEKWINQMEDLSQKAKDNYNLSKDIYDKLDTEIINLDHQLENLSFKERSVQQVVVNVPSQPISDPFSAELRKKISELKSKKETNNKLNKDSGDEISKLERKVKEHLDTLKKIVSEKKVWLDQLDEQDMIDLTYEDTFNNSLSHEYEYKTFFLIFEGIFLEKVQDQLHATLASKYKLFYQWMDNEFVAQKREEKVSEEEIERNRRIILNEWSGYFKKFWEVKEIATFRQQIRNIPRSSDDKYDIYVDTLKEVIFAIYKKKCFDAWEFKNRFLDTEEFNILETFGNELLKAKGINESSQRDVDCLSALMNIVNNLKEQAELLTVDGPNLEEILKHKAAGETIGEALKKTNDARIGNRLGPIKRNKIPHLNKIFLPAMITLKTIMFITIGNKRVKHYLEAIKNVSLNIL